MTKEQEMMFEKEIYNVINTMKKADKNTREDLQIYIDGIKCALKFMGYDYDFNGESVRLWRKEWQLHRKGKSRERWIGLARIVEEMRLWESESH